MEGLLLFFEVVKGLLITGRHLVVNLFRHTLHYLFRLKWVRKGSVTLLYPEERPSLSQRHRSRHRMMFREDGKPRCVACMLCPTICPSDCLFVEAEDVEGDRYAVRFQVDLSLCCFCGFCVEVCPEDAIRMDTGKLDFVALNREGLLFDLLENKGEKGLNR